MFLKWVALLFQAVLPAAMVAFIGHLTSLPKSEWQWFEYSLATVLIGFTGIIMTALIWRVSEWLRNLAGHYTENS